jgi:hypothetical protein
LTAADILALFTAPAEQEALRARLARLDEIAAERRLPELDLIDDERSAA